MKTEYWMLTIKQGGNFSTETYWHKGHQVKFILDERLAGRNTDIVYSHKISKGEYNLALEELS